MVTVRQVVRSYTAAVRAAERSQKRNAREAARIYKEQQNRRELASAADAVKQYENCLEVISSIHKTATEKLDWTQIENDPEPPKPERKNLHESEAQTRLSAFKPSFFDKLFGYKRKITFLTFAVENGKDQDKKEYKLAQDEFEDWRKIQTIAKGIASKDPQSYSEALNYFEPFIDISDLGSRIKFDFEKDFVEVDLYINSEEIIPDHVLSQTKTGKLSQKDMPKGKFNELYQDYVCGCVLRVARETLAYLPIKMVAVHAIAKMVDPATGHLKDVPIVSAIFPPETIDALNFQALDPSDSLRNFLHNMQFSKLNGFNPVDRVNIREKMH